MRILRLASEKILRDRQKDNTSEDLIGLLSGARDPKSQKALSIAEQRDNLIGFFIAGHESTAVALTWALYLIASHPVTQKRIYNEIQKVSGNGPLTFEHLEKLVFTKAVFNETLRLYPSIPIIGREAISDITIMGKKFHQNDTVLIPIYVIQRSARFWKNPNSFQPDRFLHSPGLARGNPTFMPFGAGPRVCIGASFAMMESVLAISNIIRHFDVSLASTTTPKPLVTVSLRPDKDIFITFKKR